MTTRVAIDSRVLWDGVKQAITDGNLLARSVTIESQACDVAIVRVEFLLTTQALRDITAHAQAADARREDHPNHVANAELVKATGAPMSEGEKLAAWAKAFAEDMQAR